MAIIINVSQLAFVYLTAGVSQLCYSQPDCEGDIVTAPGPTARDCCVGTDAGQSYSDDGVNCILSQCIGMYPNYCAGCVLITTVTRPGPYVPCNKPLFCWFV